MNPWFSNIPKKYYILDNRFVKYFKFPTVKPYEIKESNKKMTKHLEQINEKILDELSDICNYGNGTKSNKIITKIYQDYSDKVESSIFLSKYVKNLFQIYYRMNNGLDKKKYIDIENIINSKHISDISPVVSEWYYANREHISWEIFDRDKKTLDRRIVDTIEKKFSRNKKLSEHTIVNDGYFKSFILTMINNIKKNYELYLKTNDKYKIRTYLFNILIVNYAFETQHYFHALNNGMKFKSILKLKNLFNDIENFSNSNKIKFIDNNIIITKWGLIGEIDLLDKNNIIWEIKCVSEITLKHVIQVLMYNLMYCNNEQNIYNVNIINFLKGELVTIKINLDNKKINRIKEIFSLD